MNDVEEVVKEMNEDSFREIPSLQGSVFNQLYLSRPEDEIRRCTSAYTTPWFLLYFFNIFVLKGEWKNN